MKTLRSCVKLVMVICLIGQFSAIVWAQNYPTKPIRYIVPSTGNTELVGRLIAAGLTEVLGQQVYVDVRAGGGTNIGAEIAARAPADGYTLFQVLQAHAVNVSLYHNLSYDLMRDFTAVTELAVSPNTVVVHPSLAANSISDLVKLAKEKPGALNYGSAGSGTSTSLAGELFKITTGTNIVEVPYKGGGPALNAVVAGEVSIYFGPLASVLPFVEQGKLRLLAVTTTKRLSVLPECPTVAESGYPDYEVSNWYGLMVPAKTPQGTISTIHKAVVEVLNRPDVGKRMADMGFTIGGNQPEEFAEFIRSDIEKWREVVKRTGMTAN